MTRFTPGMSAAAVLLGVFLTAGFAEAREVRSTADRRQRPGQGLWKSSAINMGSSYRSNNSWFRSTPQYYSQSQYLSTPRYYSQPHVAAQRIVHQQRVVQFHDSVPQSHVIAAPASVHSAVSTPFQQKVTPQPSDSDSPVHKVVPTPVPPVAQQPVSSLQR